MFIEDIVTLGTEAGIAAAGTVFASSQAGVPDGDGPFTTITEYPGRPPQETHNAGYFQQPHAQILVRATDTEVARARAYEWYYAVSRVRNRTINGCFYQHIRALQEPFDLGLDDNERVRYVFNVTGRKNPS